ncbi:MAG: hypothetical protein NC305_19140 [Lachnospiraceae bacterium]|nr:hypothetical protein [Lachnospiraceae bacterium]
MEKLFAHIHFDGRHDHFFVLPVRITDGLRAGLLCGGIRPLFLVDADGVYPGKIP